jgi:hypothetical protein
MSDFTDREERVLLAGLIGGWERDAVWAKFPDAIERLGAEGLIRIGQESSANGIVSSFPLCLSPLGVIEARRLQGVDELR